MNLEEILNNRRSVRIYDETKAIDSEKVKKCIELATLSPTSSNMQLWEFYHITDKEILKEMIPICLEQNTVKTAQELVIFVTRQDYYKKRAKSILNFEIGNVKRTSPKSRQASRIKDKHIYYGKIIPFLYTRFFGILGFIRKIGLNLVGIFKPTYREASEQDMRIVIHKSVALAAQTFMLAMSEINYDTCPMEGFDSKRVKKILELPRYTDINMIISCGVRKSPHGIWGDRYRIPFNEVYKRI